MEATDINEELDLRLEQLIESHVSNLRTDFRRLIDDLSVPASSPAEAADGSDHAEALAQLKRSVDTIHAAGNQREMAYRLLDAAGHQAARAALFLVRGESCVGFEARAFTHETIPFDQVRISPPEGDPLCAALERQETMHLHGSSLAGTCLAQWLAGSEAQQVCLSPVVVGGQTVAILYADSGESTEASGIYPESIEILTSVAGMYLERLRRPTPTASQDETTTAGASNPDTAPPELQADDPDSALAAQTTEPEPLSDIPEEPSLAPSSEAVDPAATQVVTSGGEETLPADEPAPPTFDAGATVALTDLPDPAADPVAADIPDLQPESLIDEDAQRFARLLVSEIVLYNEAQVKAGQKKGDLLARLKEPIQLSRQSYLERFGSQAIICFDDELVRTLAQGDPALLGVSGT
ncbi:MAG: hypothetical protein E2P03_03305 [Acidobacteria bacterium]|nr:MAG: hypothetical protein E2P03_03305 [Acidobacteriota bacterium]